MIRTETGSAILQRAAHAVIATVPTSTTTMLVSARPSPDLRRGGGVFSPVLADSDAIVANADTIIARVVGAVQTWSERTAREYSACQSEIFRIRDTEAKRIAAQRIMQQEDDLRRQQYAMAHQDFSGHMNGIYESLKSAAQILKAQQPPPPQAPIQPEAMDEVIAEGGVVDPMILNTLQARHSDMYFNTPNSNVFMRLAFVVKTTAKRHADQFVGTLVGLTPNAMQFNFTAPTAGTPPSLPPPPQPNLVAKVDTPLIIPARTRTHERSDLPCLEYSDDGAESSDNDESDADDDDDDANNSTTTAPIAQPIAPPPKSTKTGAPRRIRHSCHTLKNPPPETNWDAVPPKRRFSGSYILLSAEQIRYITKLHPWIVIVSPPSSRAKFGTDSATFWLQECTIAFAPSATPKNRVGSYYVLLQFCKSNRYILDMRLADRKATQQNN
jgi:hypothetical protein